MALARAGQVLAGEHVTADWDFSVACDTGIYAPDPEHVALVCHGRRLATFRVRRSVVDAMDAFREETERADALLAVEGYEARLDMRTWHFGRAMFAIRALLDRGVIGTEET